MRRNSKGMMVSNWDANTTGLVEVFDTYMGDMPDPGVWLMEHTAFEARAVFRNLTLENGARSRPFLRKCANSSTLKLDMVGLGSCDGPVHADLCHGDGATHWIRLV